MPLAIWQGLNDILTQLLGKALFKQLWHIKYNIIFGMEAMHFTLWLGDSMPVHSLG